ncbi:MAG: hypothetical protein LPK02_12540, partial [Rhodobacterales bacterium]|nr:hypothetical protein [Rhodobacterales bacterium]MDX5413859.1 hypothetical protein [Rhodobacterales bacterium]
MATIFETDDAALGATTIYTLTEGDSFEGALVLDDTGDSVTADLVAGQTYTFTLVSDGLPGLYALSYDNGTDSGSVSGGFSTENPSETLVLTFTATTTGPYTLTIVSDGGITYTLTFGTLAPTGPTTGDDVLTGTSSADVLDLLDGNDSIAAGGGSDRISGGAGNDTIMGDSGNDRLNGDAGADSLNGGSGRDTL